MELNIVKFSSLLFIGLALGPSLAHLFELPNKIGLSRDNYLTVQQIYRGWALFGFVVAGALVSTFTLTFMLWKRSSRGAWVVFASFLCIIATQIVFWTLTYPANAATQNWTVLPDNWIELRKQWEYSHAAGAGLNLVAFISLIVSALADNS